jgi:hypothetical protein
MNRRLLNLIGGTLTLSVGLWAADPLLGTWKLNLEKSKFGSRPMPKSNQITWTEKGGTFRYAAKGVGPNGQPTQTEIPSFKFDGKEYPLSTGGTVALKRADPLHFQSTGMKNGKKTFSNKSVISKDGKTITSVWQMADESGKLQSWTSVLDKQ